MFKVFAGITQITYNGKPDYLVNVFFNNNTVSNVYWGMALIGIVMCFAFAIMATIRKTFDLEGRMQQSLGQILTSVFKSIMMIVSLTAVMIVVLNATGVLMQQVNYIFNDAPNLDLPETVTFTDEEYAAMGRVLNTIGNFAINPSASSRYNINSCYNAIRRDMKYLQDQNVFRYYYASESGRSWQSVLQKIANGADLTQEIRMDVSNESVTTALLEAMEILKTDSSFKPLAEYHRTVPKEPMVPLDRFIFLLASMQAAKNSVYNESPNFNDPLRLPYYIGEKSLR